MALYSIKEMSVLSGIKPHTIRIWEKRYSVFSPQRTETNIRKYSDDDLRLLLNVSILLSMGYKISRIANLSDVEISSIITKGNDHTHPPPIPEILFKSVMDLNEREFTKKIDEGINDKGFEWTFENLLVPFQKRMGMLWQAGTITPVHEHFASNIIREILISATKTLPVPNENHETILMFLPEGEFHELGLLFFKYIVIKEGFNTIYLGQTAPLRDINNLKYKGRISALITSVTKPIPKESLQVIFNKLKERYPEAKQMASGLFFELEPNIIPDGVEIIKSSEHLKVQLKGLIRK